MLKSASKFIEEWNQHTSERAKLQHSYVVLAIASILIAGLVGLINYDLGQQLVALALICAGVFLANALAWALLSGLILVKLNQPSTPVVPAKIAASKPKKK